MFQCFIACFTILFFLYCEYFSYCFYLAFMLAFSLQIYVGTRETTEALIWNDVDDESLD